MDITDEDLNFVLSRFTLEIRKKSGDNYPETLYEIVIYIQLYMSMYGKMCRLLDPIDFVQIRNTLDNRMKELCKIGCVKPCR